MTLKNKTAVLIVLTVLTGLTGLASIAQAANDKQVIACKGGTKGRIESIEVRGRRDADGEERYTAIYRARDARGSRIRKSYRVSVANDAGAILFEAPGAIQVIAWTTAEEAGLRWAPGHTATVRLHDETLGRPVVMFGGCKGSILLTD